MRALIPPSVSAGVRQSGSRPEQPAWSITGLTTRAFPRPLLLTTPPRAFPRPILLTTRRVLDYSDDIVFLSYPPHFVYQLPTPLSDNSIIFAVTVSVLIVFFSHRSLKHVIPIPHSQRSLNSCTSWFSNSQMRTTQVSIPRDFFSFLFLKTQVLLCLVVGGGGFHRPCDHSIQEILTSLRTFTYKAERTLDLPRRRNRQGTSPCLST